MKYATGSVVGQTPPTNPTTVHYDFATWVNSVFAEGDSNGIDLREEASATQR